MAEEESDKTDQVSQRRMRTAWEEGQIPMAKDAVMAASLAAGVCALILVGSALSEALIDLTGEAMRTLSSAEPRNLISKLLRPSLLTFGVCAAAAVGGIAATITQTKGNFWPDHAMPDFTRLFGGSKILTVFKKQFWTDLGIAIVKAVALAYVIYQACYEDFMTMGKLLTGTPSAQLLGMFKPLASASGKVLATVAAMAAIDFFLTHRRFNEQMKMTAEEAKREHKEEEGDPTYKGKRRKRHREIMKGIAKVEVPKADALIVNPTHIAIAIRYRKDEGLAPRVTCKGKGKLAEHMRELARENGIPIIQDIPLARLLYKKVKVGREVPMETYKAVAAILAFVYRVTGRSMGAAA